MIDENVVGMLSRNDFESNAFVGIMQEQNFLQKVTVTRDQCRSFGFFLQEFLEHSLSDKNQLPLFLQDPTGDTTAPRRQFSILQQFEGK